ncbi:hypothetical protein HELRODRAFT_184207 [Helobdella robusta]|uniref:Uncharacterized protein n=1 Tax=Helobdella robusta TaxID=6412 RepID=T1FKR7_HELRO|nr:hypothetical protein HELRODRAFT_184207 [Helobdella robusta]ESO05148.1 hypothetical protein HELRODRAFT_184207 [Helobdella robusta]
MIGTKLRACYSTVNGLMAWRVIVGRLLSCSEYFDGIEDDRYKSKIKYDDLQLWSDGLEYHRQKINTSVFLSECCPAVNSLTSMSFDSQWSDGLVGDRRKIVKTNVFSLESMMSYVYGLMDWSNEKLFSEHELHLRSDGLE